MVLDSLSKIKYSVRGWTLSLKKTNPKTDHLFPLLGCASQGVQVAVGEQLRLHGGDSLLQGA